MAEKNKDFETGEFARGRGLIHLIHSLLDIVPCGYHHLVQLRDDLFVTKFSLSRRGK